MADYGKFQQSAPFRRLLASVVVEQDGEDRVLACTGCADAITDVDDGTDMSVLVQAVIDHDCAADDLGI